jgi:hypothetical protein
MKYKKPANTGFLYIRQAGIKPKQETPGYFPDLAAVGL